MKVRFEDNQVETVTQNVLDIYVTWVTEGRINRNGQTGYNLLNARIGTNYANAASFLKEMKAAKFMELDNMDGSTVRVDIAKRTIKYDIVRCWYCDGTNRPRTWEMDCDGPYQESTCERCGSDREGYFGHFGCNQRDMQKAREAQKYHIPARNWRESDDYAEFGYEGNV